MHFCLPEGHSDDGPQEPTDNNGQARNVGERPLGADSPRKPPNLGHYNEEVFGAHATLQLCGSEGVYDFECRMEHQENSSKFDDISIAVRERKDEDLQLYSFQLKSYYNKGGELEKFVSSSMLLPEVPNMVDEGVIFRESRFPIVLLQRHFRCAIVPSGYDRIIIDLLCSQEVT